MRKVFFSLCMAALLMCYWDAGGQVNERISRGAISAGGGTTAIADTRVQFILGQPVFGDADGDGQYMRLGFYAKARWLPTSIPGETAEAPARFFLSQNYPNPFNGATIIEYSLQQAGHVRLRIFDMLGREVATCVDGLLAAGPHRFIFQAGHLPTGVYYYLLESGAITAKRKSTLIK